MVKLRSVTKSFGGAAPAGAGVRRVLRRGARSVAPDLAPRLAGRARARRAGPGAGTAGVHRGAMEPLRARTGGGVSGVQPRDAGQRAGPPSDRRGEPEVRRERALYGRSRIVSTESPGTSLRRQPSPATCPRPRQWRLYIDVIPTSILDRGSTIETIQDRR